MDDVHADDDGIRNASPPPPRPRQLVWHRFCLGGAVTIHAARRKLEEEELNEALMVCEC